MASHASDLVRVLQGASIVLRHVVRDGAPEGINALRTASSHAADAAKQVGAVAPEMAYGLANSSLRAASEASAAATASAATAESGPSESAWNAPDFEDAPPAPPASSSFAAPPGGEGVLNASDAAAASATLPSHLQPEQVPATSRVHSSSALATADDAFHPVPERSGDLKDADLAASFARERSTRMARSRERAVPASQVSRVFGFGSLAAGLAAGTMGEVLKRAVGGGRSESSAAGAPEVDGVSPSALFTAGEGSSSSNPVITEANAERLAEALCRMRGAALKLGQMISIQDESVMSPQLLRILDRVRANADIMPAHQVQSMLTAELGPGWKDLVSDFSDAPVAAASIGQVHAAKLHSEPEKLRAALGQERWDALVGDQGDEWVDELAGRDVALKVQYPGVAESINSDLMNLKRLVTYTNLLPPGLYVDEVIRVAKEELALECDYKREAWCTNRYRGLVADDACFAVPRTVPYLTGRRVVATEMMEGVPIDVVSQMSQQTRNRVARRMLRLTMRELFEWRFMQTDPNWGNFLYDPSRDLISLLDFGATREYGEEFVDEYMNVVWAAANGDRDSIIDSSIKLGFLTGDESKKMLEAHVDAGLAVGQPFATEGSYDFSNSNIAARVGQQGETFMNDRLTPPPQEVYSLHRKLSGAFLMCMKLGSNIHCRDILEQVRDEVLHRRALRA